MMKTSPLPGVFLTEGLPNVGMPLALDKGQSFSFDSTPSDSPERINKAAEEFEALLLQQMFDVMWSSVPNGGLLEGGSEAEFYRDMLNQELSKEIAHSQSIGLKKAFADDMVRTVERERKVDEVV
jgi:Rod binding domain-containing protein